ncbi:MAG: tryptophan synthase subunit alpha [Candidatus Omnitrophota bacterium]
MSRLKNKFNELKRKNRCAFIAYITAGDPNLSKTKEIVQELEKSGVDIIELGVPFSDPLADGPVIQAASQRALKNGTSLTKIIRLVKALRFKVKIPLCLMSYYNPIYKMGLAHFAQMASEAGVDGVIVPDLPVEEAGPFIRCVRKAKLDTIFFVAPTSAGERIKKTANASSGFIYYISLTGITGARKELSRDLRGRINSIKKYSRNPVCVGFGVSRPKQVKELSSFCDGVIVGSAIVSRVSANLKDKNLVHKVGNFVRGLTNV